MGKLEIAAALKNARNYRGFTQADAAKATDLTYQAISNYERGTNRVDSLTLDKLCSLYRISVESVLDCREWELDYVEDFLRAKDEATKRDILKGCGPCPRFICEYNDYLLGAGKMSTSVPEGGHAENIVKIAGRDGRFVEKRLSDKELQALMSFVDLLPDASDDL